MSKIIFHIDINAFFAQVEKNNDPSLKNLPVVIGGVKDGDVSRGIVCTASYEARKYGVKSGMPMFKAYELCPDMVSIKSKSGKYHHISKSFFNLLKNNFSTKIEIASIDECYMDLTSLNKTYKNPITIAKLIQKMIFEELQLTVSIGISYNRYLAKMGSSYKKPDAITYIKDNIVAEALFYPLKISSLNGIGVKTLKLLNSNNIFWIKDLFSGKKDYYLNLILKEKFLFFKSIFSSECNVGIMYNNNFPKSISSSVTFRSNRNNKEFVLQHLYKNALTAYTNTLSWNLNIKSFSVSLKDSNLKLKSRNYTQKENFKNFEEIWIAIIVIFDKFYNSEIEYRLTGIAFNDLKYNNSTDYKKININTSAVLQELSDEGQDVCVANQLYLINKHLY